MKNSEKPFTENLPLLTANQIPLLLGSIFGPLTKFPVVLFHLLPQHTAEYKPPLVLAAVKVKFNLSLQL